MFTWWGLYKSVPYELAVQKLGGEYDSDCVELQVNFEPVRESAVEIGMRERRGEDNDSRADA